MSIKFVYVASPFANGDQVANVRNSIECAEELVAHGYIPYVPLLNMLWDMMSSHPREYWIDLDMPWLEKCDALIRLPGISPGADAEANEMRKQGKPVFFSVKHLVVTEASWSEAEDVPAPKPSETPTTLKCMEYCSGGLPECESKCPLVDDYNREHNVPS